MFKVDYQFFQVDLKCSKYYKEIMFFYLNDGLNTVANLLSLEPKKIKINKYTRYHNNIYLC